MSESVGGAGAPEGALAHKILAYLQSHHTMSLATAAGGVPHAASLFYVNIGFELFFVSSPESRHALELSGNPEVSATINEDYANWMEIKGIQLEGEAVCLGGLASNARIVAAYIRKFPNVADFFLAPAKLGGSIARKVAKVRFYRISPRRFYYIENATGFGKREELRLK